MNKIGESLEKLFEKHRLVFWYDAEGSMRERYEELELEEVEKIELDGNPFGLKYKVLRVDPGRRFLVYSAKPRPADEANWLLDLELSHHIFHADRASLLVQELGLALPLKPLIERHADFFNAAKRVEKLRRFVSEGSDEESLMLGMCAVVLGCEAAWDAVLQTIFAQMAMQKDAKLEQLQKYGLTQWIYRQAGQYYGYESESPTLKELLVQMLLSHFFTKVDPDKRPLGREAALFVSRWMDSSRNREHFVTLSREVAYEIGVEGVLAPYDAQRLLESDTFEAIDRRILLTLKAMLMQDACPCEEVLETVRLRRTLFWYEDFKNLYEAMEHAASLMSLRLAFQPTVSTLESGFESYTGEWYRIDFHYRKFVYHFRHAEHPEVLKKLSPFVEGRYVTFLRELGDAWQSAVDAMESWRIGGVTMQREFYDRFVAPAVSDDQKKVYVIISDALRYEAGVELAQRLAAHNRLEVESSAMAAALPSYTQLGIASLLPHETLSFDAKDATVYVDHQSSAGTKNRDRILKARFEKSVYLNAEEFLAMGRDEGRAFVKNYRVFYIYHNDIDAAGDKAASESNVFDAVEMAFLKIEKLVKQVFNFNGTHVLITADHGFLYHEADVEDPDQCEMPKGGEVYKSNRRFIIGKDLPNVRCAVKFGAKQLGIDDEAEVSLPRSINKFRVQGAGNRFVHGGMSLQEVVVPLIRCSKRRKDDERTVEVNLIKSFSRITANQIGVSLIQRESVDAKCKPRILKMAFYAKDGTLLSDVQKGIFDKKAQDLRNLEQKFSFHFNAKAGEYNGQTVYLRMMEAVEGTSMERLYKEEPYEMLISFTNDFEEF
ncbi:BREX-1 system phosphatase PglZ type A [Hydrogenimonas cancrithermarum]|uniref:PglZ domain-containing protein n=1 Tax=Hydrogenimonas cancrithermarum TaxID=2993563 RepID=A0ABM8FJL2_9BACT|nr:BREX-1 system phosphatase PglZ type A [Hydrogenimonas cancrithermarum]BDY12481.1 hypothetical protein HCR_07930 [Hydrogenimonas cancrithermarum]